MLPSTKISLCCYTIALAKFGIFPLKRPSSRNLHRSTKIMFDNTGIHMLQSPSAELNKDPIWNVMEAKVLPFLNDSPVILEIAAGAGIHTKYFSQKINETRQDCRFQWYPTDADHNALPSILAHSKDSIYAFASGAVKPPLLLTLNENGILEETTKVEFSDVWFDFIVNINMIHISPWSATVGLMKFAGEKLKSETGYLLLYGPFKQNGTYTESNRVFDASLQQRDNRWGIRDVEAVMKQAELNDIAFLEYVQMPANNLALIFQKK